MLKEAHADKSRLMESQVSRGTGVVAGLSAGPQCSGLRGSVCWQEREMELRRQALEDERRRREQLERRLQDETARRQKLVEKEVKLREKHFSQVPGGCHLQHRVPSPSRAPHLCLGEIWLLSHWQALQGSAFPGSSPDAVPPHPQRGF